MGTSLLASTHIFLSLYGTFVPRINSKPITRIQCEIRSLSLRDMRATASNPSIFRAISEVVCGFFSKSSMLSAIASLYTSLFSYCLLRSFCSCSSSSSNHHRYSSFGLRKYLSTTVFQMAVTSCSDGGVILCVMGTIQKRRFSLSLRISGRLKLPTNMLWRGKLSSFVPYGGR